MDRIFKKGCHMRLHMPSVRWGKTDYRMRLWAYIYMERRNISACNTLLFTIRTLATDLPTRLDLLTGRLKLVLAEFTVRMAGLGNPVQDAALVRVPDRPGTPARGDQLPVLAAAVTNAAHQAGALVQPAVRPLGRPFRPLYRSLSGGVALRFFLAVSLLLVAHQRHDRFCRVSFGCVFCVQRRQDPTRTCHNWLVLGLRGWMKRHCTPSLPDRNGLTSKFSTASGIITTFCCCCCCCCCYCCVCAWSCQSEILLRAVASPFVLWWASSFWWTRTRRGGLSRRILGQWRFARNARRCAALLVRLRSRRAVWNRSGKQRHADGRHFLKAEHHEQCYRYMCPLCIQGSNLFYY